MSAERDQSQKFKFVYSNLYQLYQKGKVAAKNAPGVVSGTVIKAGAKVQPLARPYEGRDFSQEKRINLQRVHEMRESAPEKKAVASLRQNLSELENIQNRLRFMLQELEDLTKHSKS
jgi:hypothetical protein